MGREPDEVARQSGPDGNALVRITASRRIRLAAARDTPVETNGPVGHPSRRLRTRAGAVGPARAGRAGPGRTSAPARDVPQCAFAPPRRAEQADVSYGQIGRAVDKELEIRVVRGVRMKGAVRGQEPTPGAAPAGQTLPGGVEANAWRNSSESAREEAGAREPGKPSVTIRVVRASVRTRWGPPGAKSQHLAPPPRGKRCLKAQSQC